MRDVSRLLAAFEAGRLLRPSSDVTNLVDLSNTIAYLAGAGDIPLTSGARQLTEIIGDADHLVFVVADGFGMSFVEEMDHDAFLPGHVARELLTVFPSTTASVLTTLATGEWPAAHAALGWFLYLPEIGQVSTILPFIRRSDGKSLTKLGVEPERAFPVPPLVSRIDRATISLAPADIAGSVYSRYLAGGSRRDGYTTLGEAVDAVLGRIVDATGPTFTYVYWPNVDAAAHKYGATHRNVATAVAELDLQMNRLAVEAPPGARVVLTADHGLLDADEEETHWIVPGDELSECLSREPSGDAREVYFAVKDGQGSTFRARFAARFEDRFLLLTTTEAEDLRLFGPGPLSAVSRQRLGDLVAVSAGRDAIRYRWSDQPEATKPYASHHSGLTPEEMRVPLIVL